MKLFDERLYDSARKSYTDTLADALKPDPLLKPSEWASRHRMLDSSTSAEPGKWDNDRTPYLREILDSLGNQDPCEIVSFKKAAQIGGSEVINNWIGYSCDQSPSSFLLVQPRGDDAKDYVKRRLAPMFASTPRLAAIGLSSGTKTSENDNTILNKSFPGGFLKATGANSPIGLRSNPIRRAACDEVDGYPIDAGGEGDPLDLVYQRTATFPNRKLLFVSTPTIKGMSRISKAFTNGDQRRYHVPCPRCGAFQILEWNRVIWLSGKPETARYRCAHCQDENTPFDELIQNYEKTKMLLAGEWIPENSAFDDAGNVIPPKHKSYHINALYAPHGWLSWGDLAGQFRRAAKDPVKLKVFVNTKLGEAWDSADGASLDPSDLLERREDWGDLLPLEVGLITAGVDVQANRLEVHIMAWAANNEAWSIDYITIWGDPTARQVWADLDAVRARTYKLTDGATEMPIAAACIDTGGSCTQSVYEYVKDRQRGDLKLWGIKGKAGKIPIWPKRPSKVYKGKVTLFILGVDSAKEDIYNRLHRDTPGAGYIHFGFDWDAERFAQLTSETMGVRYHKGFKTTFWHKPDGMPNEALDCTVYAYGAMQGLASQGRTAKASLDLREHTAQGGPVQPKPAHARRKGWIGRSRDHIARR
jgi:phage terminase large subunit GpA-like protein